MKQYRVYEVTRGENYSLVLLHTETEHELFRSQDGWSYQLLFESPKELRATQDYQRRLSVELEAKYDGFIDPDIYRIFCGD